MVAARAVEMGGEKGISYSIIQIYKNEQVYGCSLVVTRDKLEIRKDRGKRR
jgi:hypothetical protein